MANVGPETERLSSLTVTAPVAVPEGTTATICVSFQVVTVSGMLFNVTVLKPCDNPNPVPVIVTDEPIGPAVGETPVTASVPSTVNWTPLLVSPDEVTVTGPVVAAAVTETVMAVFVQV